MFALRKILPLLLLATVSGCRLGNRIQRTEAPSDQDPLTGYYETQPQKLTFCA